MFQYNTNVEDVLKKSKECFEKTVDFQKGVIQSSVDLFNVFTDKKFYTYSTAVPQSFNFVADNVKETVFKGFDYLQGHFVKS